MESTGHGMKLRNRIIPTPSLSSPCSSLSSSHLPPFSDCTVSTHNSTTSNGKSCDDTKANNDSCGDGDGDDDVVVKVVKSKRFKNKFIVFDDVNDNVINTNIAVVIPSCDTMIPVCDVQSNNVVNPDCDMDVIVPKHHLRKRKSRDYESDNEDGSEDDEDEGEDEGDEDSSEDGMLLDEIDCQVSDMEVTDWFKQLSTEQKQEYKTKLTNLLTINSDDIPTLKDVLDLTSVDKRTVKELIEEIHNLEVMVRTSTEFEDKCRQIRSRLDKLKAGFDSNSLRDDITVSIVDKIIQSRYSDTVKKHLYNLYTNSVDDEHEAPKMLRYVDYALKLPAALPLSNPNSKPLSNSHITSNSYDNNLSSSNLVSSRVELNTLLFKLHNELNTKIYGLGPAKEELITMIFDMMVAPQPSLSPQPLQLSTGPSSSTSIEQMDGSISGLVGGSNGGSSIKTSYKPRCIGLCGPPGVGKSNIVKIIASVFSLPASYINLDSMRDSISLMGLAYSYISADAGAIIKSVIELKSEDRGLIFFDELDKIGKTETSLELLSNLLLITDPSRNHSIHDNFLNGVPVDLSKYILVFAMNDDKELPPALKSRIPIIHLDGYNTNDKRQILTNYIIPELYSEYTFKTGDIVFSQLAIEALLNNVHESDDHDHNCNHNHDNTQKSGVRRLKDVVLRIFRRLNMYYLASVDGKLNIKVSFSIDNFQIPYTITPEFVKLCIQSSPSDHKFDYVKNTIYG